MIDLGVVEVIKKIKMKEVRVNSVGIVEGTGILVAIDRSPSVIPGDYMMLMWLEDEIVGRCESGVAGVDWDEMEFGRDESEFVGG